MWIRKHTVGLKGQPLILIAHSDDFRWFGPLALISEWDLLIATFNSHNYEVTDVNSKEFVGIRITCDENFNYYMDQSRMSHSSYRRPTLLALPMSIYHIHLLVRVWPRWTTLPISIGTCTISIPTDG